VAQQLKTETVGILARPGHRPNHETNRQQLLDATSDAGNRIRGAAYALVTNFGQGLQPGLREVFLFQTHWSSYCKQGQRWSPFAQIKLDGIATFALRPNSPNLVNFINWNP